MNMTQEHRVWKACRFHAASLTLSLAGFLGRPSRLAPALLGLALATASCSKEEEPDEDRKPIPQAAASPTPAPVAAAVAPPEPAAKKAPPMAVVTPGHIPPNPRVSQIISGTGDGPVGAPAPAPLPEPAPPAPMHTPAQANQARLRALEEMYRLRGQPPEAPAQPQTQTQPGDPPDSRPVDKSAPTKNQP